MVHYVFEDHHLMHVYIIARGNGGSDMANKIELSKFRS